MFLLLIPRIKKIIKFLFIIFILLTLVFVVNLLYKQITTISLTSIIHIFKTVPSNRIITAFILMIVYYIILGCYDIIAIKYLVTNHILIQYRNILLICFISNSIGNNLGFSMIFGGSLRYRLYSRYNISIIDITQILLFTPISMLIGLMMIGAFMFLFTNTYYKIDRLLQLTGIVFIVIILIYCLFSILSTNKTIKIFNKTIVIPNIRIIILQIVLSTLDWIISSLILYVFLYTIKLKYLTFLKIFLISQLCSVMSQVPGGVGIFETTIMLFVPTMKKNIEFIVGLLSYRILFYIIPLIIGIILLVFFEITNVIKILNKKIKSKC